MTTDNASQDARQLTAGERLRQARESAGLSVTEVADRQHLRPAVIAAIEKGDYSQVDSELFLKGYVRAYASQVGLDPDSVVRQLDGELEPLREQKKAQVEANPLVTIERRKRRKRQVARVVFVLVVLAALFYGGSLYLAHQQAEEAVSDDSNTGQLNTPAVPVGNDGMPGDDVEPVPDAGEAAPAEADQSLDTDPQTEESELQSSAVVEQENGTETGPEVTEVTSGDDDPEATDEAGFEGEAAGPEPGTVDMGSDPVPVPTIAEEPDTTPPPVPETVSPEQDEAGRLVASFNDDCWVEVQDSNGRVLVAELRRAGETLDVTGEGPLRVVFGAVDAVSSVRYGGEPVDLSARPARNNRVVLTLSQ
ncbi:cytoskeleton protein RodZ [Marinobacter daqiaonensis]|uniref:Cytoskeleton protein RodZ n=1 Tax=Marinobacter daqiaonensis TaxID=650891 RepID=A0A1I6GLJ5_9GAMM|nr:RodZ domain-containing protein [Marinobacter daqiaonensis]SFR43026.1 cytoskeleton protein RodZ [Marinobacter daqiaonensis]